MVEGGSCIPNQQYFTLPFCPSPQANTQQPLASMVTSAAECQQSDSSAEPQTDSDSRPCGDEVYTIL